MGAVQYFVHTAKSSYNEFSSSVNHELHGISVCCSGAMEKTKVSQICFSDPEVLSIMGRVGPGPEVINIFSCST